MCKKYFTTWCESLLAPNESRIIFRGTFLNYQALAAIVGDRFFQTRNWKIFPRDTNSDENPCTIGSLLNFHQDSRPPTSLLEFFYSAKHIPLLLLLVFYQ